VVTLQYPIPHEDPFLEERRRRALEEVMGTANRAR
jgi:hypothetical protein